VRTLIDKVAKHAYKVTDEECRGGEGRGPVRGSDLRARRVAALGQAKRQLDSALVALAETRGRK